MGLSLLFLEIQATNFSFCLSWFLVTASMGTIKMQDWYSGSSHRKRWNE